MRGREEPAIGHALRGAAMVAADGMPIVWLQRRLGYPTAERVYGPDMMLSLCQQGASHHLKHFLLGGTPQNNARLIEVLQTKIPTLHIVGASSPMIQNGNEPPDPALVDLLNQSNAHIVWVGLGSPKQDLWMQQYSKVLRVPLLIGVGAAFDFLAGTKPQAPKWMQRSGLEWAYRFAKEPRRLWRRYVIYNPRFVWQVWRRHL